MTRPFSGATAAEATGRDVDRRIGNPYQSALLLEYIPGLAPGLDWAKKSPLAFLVQAAHHHFYLYSVYIYIYIYILYIPVNSKIFTVSFFKDVSSAHQACIYLILNTAKAVIL